MVRFEAANIHAAPPVFALLQKFGKIDDQEMYRVFNMGIGMVLIVPPFNADMVMDLLRRGGEKAWVIGDVAKDQRGVSIV